MSDPTYTPPKVWTWDKASGGRFANINRPIAGPTHEKELPVGKHPFQLYSLGTPNGVKVTIMFEELLDAGFKDAEYDAWLINIGEGDQFSSGFVSVNPNSKIPALMDHSTNPPTRLFESGSMLVYLAEKFGAFLPKDPRKHAEAMNWLFWQMGSAPFLGGGFGHFYAYAPEKYEYPINRYAMEVKRSWTCWTVTSRTTNTWPAMNTPSQTWRSGPGMALWRRAFSMMQPSSCPYTNTRTLSAGQTSWRSARVFSGAVW